MEGFLILKDSKLTHWKEALMCLGFYIVGSLMPIWGGTIIQILFSKWSGWISFFSHGEFSIYSAALLTSALYMMIKGPSRYKMTIILSVMALMICTILFAGVMSSDMFKITSIKINNVFLINISLILYVLSVLLFFFTTASESVRVDPRELAKKDYDTLESRFDNQFGGAK